VKKTGLFLIPALILCLLLPLPVQAEGDSSSGDDYTNTTYWNNLCKSASTMKAADKQRCDAYVSYTQSQIEGLNDMVSDLNAQIEDAQAQVEANQQKIADNQVKIDETTDTVNSLKEKLKNRIEDEQSTMHVSSVIDLLMGAKTFDQFLRIINCLSDITKSDSDTMTELTDSINELNTLQDQLKSDQETLQQKETDLENSKTAITDRQAQLVAAEQQLATMQKQYKAELAAAEAKAAAEAVAKAKAAAAAAANSSSGSSSSGSNTAPDSSDSSGNPYYGGWANCTWGCWQLVHDILGISLPRFGSAGEWLSAAAAAGYATGSTPQANCIACWSYHVAFITEVNGDSAYFKEGNLSGGYHEGWFTLSQRGGIIGYIYL
jgi:peptidoglycan hydrolase CwlO-like protein